MARTVAVHVALISILSGVVGIVWIRRAEKSVENMNAAPQLIDLASLEAGETTVESDFIEVGPHVAVHAAGYFTYESSFVPKAGMSGESKCYGIHRHRLRPALLKNEANSNVKRLVYPLISTSHPLVADLFADGGSPDSVRPSALGAVPSEGGVHILVVEMDPSMTVSGINHFVSADAARYGKGIRLVRAADRNVNSDILKTLFSGVENDRIVAFREVDASWTPDQGAQEDQTKWRWFFYGLILLPIICFIGRNFAKGFIDEMRKEMRRMDEGNDA